MDAEQIAESKRLIDEEIGDSDDAKDAAPSDDEETKTD